MVGNVTRDQVKAALTVMVEVAGAVEQSGRLNTGALYATLCHVLDLNAFDAMVKQLVGSGLVARMGNDLVWIGPTGFENSETDAQEMF